MNDITTIEIKDNNLFTGESCVCKFEFRTNIVQEVIIPMLEILQKKDSDDWNNGIDAMGEDA